MSSSVERARGLVVRGLAVALIAAAGATQAAELSPYASIGRAAKPQELAAWDIDVRPDFKGLPAGSGSVAKGMAVWESKCASCHGVFGESNEVFSPLVGGTTKDDVKTGRVARLNDASFPGRTTLMKVATVSTLWDYIHRAMPWNAPKSLSTDEVYAVTAYLLNLGGVLPDDFVMTNQNIADVQARMPNRNGMTTAHALWPGRGLGKAAKPPDVQVAACMKDCRPEPKLASFLPDFARNAHGNLAEQNRMVGAQHGADTTRPAPTRLPGPGAAPPATPAAPATAAKAADNAGAAAPMALLQKHNCLACHGVERKVVGPGFNEVARKYSGRGDAVAYLAGQVQGGSAGVWGAITMPPQTLPADDAKAIAQWLAQGAKR